MSFKSDDILNKYQHITDINFLINENKYDIKQQLNTILETLLACTSGESCSILLHNKVKNTLNFEFAVGMKNSDLSEFEIDIADGIAGWVFQNERSLIVNDTSSDDRFYSRISELIEYATHSILAVPVKAWNQTLGVIEIVNKENLELFTDEDRQWAEILANQAGIAFINSQNQKMPNSKIQEKNKSSESKIIFESKIMRDLFSRIKKIAAEDSSVFIYGESGVGKELIAEQLHSFSNRSQGPYITVNCPALPEALLESELFGHVKGSFTDAVKNRQGKIEIARGGTIFLDEIADISLSVQVKLLRVLENKTYESLGSNQIKHADVRFISASNKNLELEVKEGRFREDLYYRLNVFPLYVPSLRERTEDIPLLSEYFVNSITKKMGKAQMELSTEALEHLLNYSWPGNIRELINSIERAIILNEGYKIMPEDLLLTEKILIESTYRGKSLKNSLQLFKKHIIRTTLMENDWNQTQTAKKLKIQRSYLSRLIHQLNIKR